jgi:hypothetical protein
LLAVCCWQVNGFGTWAVTLKSDGKRSATPVCSPPGAGSPEFGDPGMGWIARSGQWGMAGEACRAVLNGPSQS